MSDRKNCFLCKKEIEASQIEQVSKNVSRKIDKLLKDALSKKDILYDDAREEVYWICNEHYPPRRTRHTLPKIDAHVIESFMAEDKRTRLHFMNATLKEHATVYTIDISPNEHEMEAMDLNNLANAVMMKRKGNWSVSYNGKRLKVELMGSLKKVYVWDQFCTHAEEGNDKVRIDFTEPLNPSKVIDLIDIVTNISTVRELIETYCLL